MRAPVPPGLSLRFRSFLFGSSQRGEEGGGSLGVCARRMILWGFGVEGGEQSANRVTAPSISWLPSFRWKLSVLGGEADVALL